MSLVSSSRIIVLALATVFFVPLLIQSPVAADIPPGGDYGGGIRVAILSSDVISVNPANTGTSSQIVHQLVYDSLARRSPDDLLPEPWLASSWTINEAAKTITFQIKSDAKWSDGSNLSVDDVAYNYGQAGYTVGTPVGSNFTIMLSAGGGSFMGDGIYLPISRKNNAPLGSWSFSGPFYANDTGAADHFTMAANINHWGGRPFLDSIRYDYYSNISLASCAFIERRATFIGMALTTEDTSTINWPCLKRIVETEESIRLPHLFYSQNPGLNVLYLGMNDAATSPLNDKALRLAIATTIDRDAFAGSFGNAIKANTEIADSFISPHNTYWFNTSIPRYRVPRSIVDNRVTKIFDAINAELELAGYMDWNFDGWRETPAMQPIVLSLLRLKSETPALVDTIENDIRSIGLKISDVPLNTTAEIMTRVAADSFTLYLGTIQADQDPAFLRDYFHGAGLSNHFNYNSAAMDAVLVSADDALNTATRQTHVRSAVNWIATDVPAAPILHFKALYVYDKLVYEGWVNQLGGINNFWSFYGLHAIPTGTMVVDVSVLKQGSRLNSGESTDVLVSVTNESGPIVGADVELTPTNGTIGVPIGVTDSTGRYTATYTAWTVTDITSVFITAKVTKSGHTETFGQTSVAVYPPAGRMSINVVFTPNKRTLSSNEAVQLTIDVSDEADSSIKITGASITIAIVPDGVGGQLSVASGTTDSNGRLQTQFSAAVSVDTNFALQITVMKAGYEDGAKSVGVVVSRIGGTPATPGLDVVFIVAIVSLMAFTYGVRRRKEGK